MEQCHFPAPLFKCNCYVIISIIRTGKLTRISKNTEKFLMAALNWPRLPIQPKSAYSHFLADSSFSFLYIFFKVLPHEIPNCCIRWQRVSLLKYFHIQRSNLIWFGEDAEYQDLCGNGTSNEPSLMNCFERKVLPVWHYSRLKLITSHHLWQLQKNQRLMFLTSNLKRSFHLDVVLIK